MSKRVRLTDPDYILKQVGNGIHGWQYSEAAGRMLAVTPATAFDIWRKRTPNTPVPPDEFVVVAPPHHDVIGTVTVQRFAGERWSPRQTGDAAQCIPQVALLMRNFTRAPIAFHVVDNAVVAALLARGGFEEHPKGVAYTRQFAAPVYDPALPVFVVVSARASPLTQVDVKAVYRCIGNDEVRQHSSHDRDFALIWHELLHDPNGLLCNVGNANRGRVEFNRARCQCLFVLLNHRGNAIGFCRALARSAEVVEIDQLCVGDRSGQVSWLHSGTWFLSWLLRHIHAALPSVKHVYLGAVPSAVEFYTRLGFYSRSATVTNLWYDFVRDDAHVPPLGFVVVKPEKGVTKVFVKRTILSRPEAREPSAAVVRMQKEHRFSTFAARHVGAKPWDVVVAMLTQDCSLIGVATAEPQQCYVVGTPMLARTLRAFVTWARHKRYI